MRLCGLSLILYGFNFLYFYLYLCICELVYLHMHCICICTCIRKMEDEEQTDWCVSVVSLPGLVCGQLKLLICPPPWPEAKEKSFAKQMRFLGLRPGGWAWYFQHQFRFSMCYPKGAHSLGHPRGQLPTFGAFWIQFQIFNVLPQGGLFVGSP